MAGVEDRLYDFVIFGATGFTGKHVVYELAKIEEEEAGLTWAVAGRTTAKLSSMLKEIGNKLGRDLSYLPIIVADTDNYDSLREMSRQTKIIINCVGPYRFYGEPVVRACIETGTHQLDVSGEPEFLEKIQLNYNDKAAAQGVYIIGAAGFDSIPCESGIQFLSQQFTGHLNGVESFLTVKSGPQGVTINSGTWLSAIHSFGNQKELKPLRGQLFPNKLPRNPYPLKGRGALFYSEELGSWCHPFLGSDKSVVARTQRYNYEHRNLKPIQLNAYSTQPTLLHGVALFILGAIFALFTRFTIGQKLLAKFPEFFTFGLVSNAGPTDQQMAETSFVMTFIGYGYDKKVADRDEQYTEPPNKKVTVKVSGPDPGYVTTPICLLQAALVVLREQDKMPAKGGVLTPGAAMRDTTLIDRLSKHGIKYEKVN